MTAALHPTVKDLRLWRRLVKQARIMAANPEGAAGDLKAAAKAARRAVAPSQDALARFGAPLIRLADAYAAMDGETRRAHVGQLGWLAEGLSPLVGGEGSGEGAELRAARRRVQVLGGGVGGGKTMRLANRLGLTLPPEDREDPRPERAPRADLDG